MSNMKYRLYSFVNHLYMNAKQWGIQTAHAATTMSVTYKHNTAQHAAYVDWATNEPTIIMCEGGNVAMLTDLYERLEILGDKLDLAVVKFHEDEASLGGVITCAAILIPDTLFNLVPNRDTGELTFCTFNDFGVCEPARLTPDEFDLVSIIKMARLA